jgi:transcriptional regulator with XRE-family HTH domain
MIVDYIIWKGAKEKMTQTDIAKAVGVDKSDLSRYKNGKTKNMTVTTAEKYFKAVNGSWLGYSLFTRRMGK